MASFHGTGGRVRSLPKVWLSRPLWIVTVQPPMPQPLIVRQPTGSDSRPAICPRIAVTFCKCSTTAFREWPQNKPLHCLCFYFRTYKIGHSLMPLSTFICPHPARGHAPRYTYLMLRTQDNRQN